MKLSELSPGPTFVKMDFDFTSLKADADDQNNEGRRTIEANERLLIQNSPNKPKSKSR